VIDLVALRFVGFGYGATLLPKPPQTAEAHTEPHLRPTDDIELRRR
jgi:hypothetical protein